MCEVHVYAVPVCENLTLLKRGKMEKTTAHYPETPQPSLTKRF